MKNTELSPKTEVQFDELSKEKELQKRIRILQGMSADELISLKLSCKRKIEDCEIYKIVFTPVSIILSVFLQVVWQIDWGCRYKIYYGIGLATYIVILSGVSVAIWQYYSQMEKAKKILDVIEELEKYGKIEEFGEHDRKCEKDAHTYDTR